MCVCVNLLWSLSCGYCGAAPPSIGKGATDAGPDSLSTLTAVLIDWYRFRQALPTVWQCVCTSCTGGWRLEGATLHPYGKYSRSGKNWISLLRKVRTRLAECPMVRFDYTVEELADEIETVKRSLCLQPDRLDVRSEHADPTV